MGDIFFLLKGFVLTALVTVILQVKIGQETLETKTERWIEASFAGQFMNDTAAGAVKLGREAYRWVQSVQIGGGTVKTEQHQVGPHKIQTKNRSGNE